MELTHRASLYIFGIDLHVQCRLEPKLTCVGHQDGESHSGSLGGALNDSVKDYLRKPGS